MTQFEIYMLVGFGCLSVALLLVSLKLSKHEQHFAGIQEILLMAGMSIHSLQHDVKELQEKKESVVNE
jgi:hypothetical protein